MSEREAGWRERLRETDVTRREALKGLAGGGLALGGAKAVDNVLVGYGVLTGTNLVDQDLASFVGARFGPSAYATGVDGNRFGYVDGNLTLDAGDGSERLPVAAGSLDRAATIDDEHGLGGRFVALARDLVAVDAGDYRFEFSTVTDFLERVARAHDAGRTRPETVGALRGSRFASIDRSVIRAFADVDPAEPGALVDGIAAGFREHANYDFARYAAGSVEDNVLFGAADLREGFRSPTSFAAILDGRNAGLFCYDFAYRSIEAFHAVAPSEQTLPVMGAVVADARHKHVYTGLASVVREDGELTVPMTFVDYMHSTQYDDLGLRGLLGEGVNAYDRRHRTSDVYWNRYARW